MIDIIQPTPDNKNFIVFDSETGQIKVSKSHKKINEEKIEILEVENLVLENQESYFF